MKEYNHKEIEAKWQERWEKEGIYKTGGPSTGDAPRRPFDKLRVERNKCYVLDMFPYPSGDGLHVGHPKGYIATDVYSRMKKMQGYDVLHPMGWDAFGLPAENYAIKNKIHPRVAVTKNIKRFKEQLSLLGFNYDWEREINTTDPEFYRWTQWIFLQMFKKGLVYQSDEPINWCPSCKTGLANEDLENGKCERCGTVVEKKPMRQWVLKITEYAERLLEGLDGLDWPESIKESQRNWIGKSEGALIKFQITNSKSQINPKFKIQNSKDFEIEVFTTRPDTLFGATYLVLSPEHLEITNHKLQITNWNEVEDYVEKAKSRGEVERTAEGREKTGVELKGIKAINPATGEEIPVWVADYVLGWYGTGAIMAVPGHDSRDFAFARKYGLEVRQVVAPRGKIQNSKIKIQNGNLKFKNEEAFEESGILINSRKFDGMDSEEAKWEITKFVKGKKVTKYKLRDWVFSRQRYWGEPIPLVFCEHCAARTNADLRGKNIGEVLNPGWVAVPENELPVKLPEVENYEPTGTGESPLANISEWVNAKCPKCKGSAKRETNTMPQWAGSSWYYLAYIVKENSKFEIRNLKLLEQWLPVDMYVGGAEHATRHLIYARFWHKFLYDIGAVSTEEPFARLQHVGLIGGADGRKMSKRYGNVINPDDVVATFGADTLRLYEMFIGPFDANIPWSEEGILGPRRFLERIWRFVQQAQNAKIKVKNDNEKCQNDELGRLLHKTVKKITEDIEGFRFNTAISALMILFNALEGNVSTGRSDSEVSSDSKSSANIDTCKTFLKLLSPFVPYMTEEIWREALEHKTSIHLETWPEWDEKMIQDETFQLVVQINGKVRGTIMAKKGISQEEAEKLARSGVGVVKYLEGKNARKVVFVSDRLINFVI